MDVKDHNAGWAAPGERDVGEHPGEGEGRGNFPFRLYLYYERGG